MEAMGGMKMKSDKKQKHDNTHKHDKEQKRHKEQKHHKKQNNNPKSAYALIALITIFLILMILGILGGVLVIADNNPLPTQNSIVSTDSSLEDDGVEAIAITVIIPPAPDRVNSSHMPNSPAPASNTRRLFPANVAEGYNYHGVREVVRIYELLPYESPEWISADSFSRNGYYYQLAEITRQLNIAHTTREHIEVVEIQTERNDLAAVIAGLKTTMDFVDEDGYIGVLHLNIHSIEMSRDGTRSSSRTVSQTREFPHLSNTDLSLIPQTINANGHTYTLANVDWRTNTATTVDFNNVAQTFTATATFTRTATSTVSTGYTTRVEYGGVLTRVSAGDVRFVATFIGTPILGVTINQPTNQSINQSINQHNTTTTTTITPQHQNQSNMEQSILTNNSGTTQTQGQAPTTGVVIGSYASGNGNGFGNVAGNSNGGSNVHGDGSGSGFNYGSGNVNSNGSGFIYGSGNVNGNGNNDGNGSDNNNNKDLITSHNSIEGGINQETYNYEYISNFQLIVVLLVLAFLLIFVFGILAFLFLKKKGINRLFQKYNRKGKGQVNSTNAINGRMKSIIDQDREELALHQHLNYTDDEDEDENVDEDFQSAYLQGGDFEDRDLQGEDFHGKDLQGEYLQDKDTYSESFEFEVYNDENNDGEVSDGENDEGD